MAKWIDADKRMALYIRDGFDAISGAGLTCACCGREVIVGAHNSNKAAATLDHLDPRAATGARYDSRPENLVTLCEGCNWEKRDATMHDYLATRPAAFAAAAWARIGQRLARNVHFGAYRAAAKAAIKAAKGQ